MIKSDWDTKDQCDKFDLYVETTADYHDGRRKHHSGAYGYDDAEWEAFQFGWNAAKEHFGVTE